MADTIMWSRAKQVNTNLIVKLNGGSTEGTNLFTYNGSGAKTINIAASNISTLPTTEIYTLIENNMYFITVHVTGVSIARDGGELQITAPYDRYDECNIVGVVQAYANMSYVTPVQFTESRVLFKAFPLARASNKVSINTFATFMYIRRYKVAD